MNLQYSLQDCKHAEENEVHAQIDDIKKVKP